MGTDFYLRRKLSLDPTDVLLPDLPGPDVLLHLAGLLGVPPEEEQARGQTVQPVDRPQVLEAVLLGEDEHHCVVTVTATRVNLENKKWENYLRSIGYPGVPSRTCWVPQLDVIVLKPFLSLFCPKNMRGVNAITTR